MAASSIVDARELKTRLGPYLNRVRRGETRFVTDRHEVYQVRQIIRLIDELGEG